MNFFLKRKSDTADTIMSWINIVQKDSGHNVKTIRCDNSWENLKLQESINASSYHIKFEFTAPSTPEQNGKVERSLTTMNGKIRAMMSSAGLTQ